MFTADKHVLIMSLHMNKNNIRWSTLCGGQKAYKRAYKAYRIRRLRKPYLTKEAVA